MQDPTVQEDAAAPPEMGLEWIVDASGCDPRVLASPERVRALLERIIAELDLKPVAAPLVHKFPAPGGVTALVLLSESHLACHTFPEKGHAAINLYCCRPRAPWPFRERLEEHLGARFVKVIALPRGPAE